jgi:hypothetical protein
LLGVGNQEAVLFGEHVHASARGEIAGVLRPTVEHDDKRHWSATIAGGYVQVVTAPPGCFAVREVTDLTAAGR